MSDKNGSKSSSQEPSQPDDLQRRIEAAQARHAGETDSETDNSLLGMAWRISTELIIAVLIGCGLGFGIDSLVGTKPFITILGLCLGLAAGLRNTFRLVLEMEAAELEKQKQLSEKTLEG